MNVPQADLNALAALALRVKETLWKANRADAATRGALLEEAAGLAANLQTRLDRAGAQKPQAVPPSRSEVPLELLDTPANRRYLSTLREAWKAGLAVDEERYGKAIGTDGCAQVIEMVLRDVEQEVHGAAGGRE